VWALLDRSDERVRVAQDAAANALAFGVAVWAISAHGHRLAV